MSACRAGVSFAASILTEWVAQEDLCGEPML